MKVSLKAARPEDRDAIAALECECFSTPWSSTAVAAELRNPNARLFVALRGKKVIGYAGVQIAADEGYITNVAVGEKYRRCGVGSLLVNALKAQAMRENLRFLTLEMRESNLAAAALYSGSGFSQVGLRRGYYERPGEDAVLMTYFLKDGDTHGHTGNRDFL